MTNEIQKKILGKLIDKYEQSKTYIGLNKTNQNFSILIFQLFPKYLDSASFEYHKKIDDAVQEIENEKLVTVQRKINGVIEKVFLATENIDKAYEKIARASRKNTQTQLLEILSPFNTSPDSALSRYALAQQSKIKSNKEVEFFKSDFNSYKNILKAVDAIESNQNEVLIRTLSVKLFNDSKELESIQSEVESILFRYGDFESKETVFSECGVMNTPTTVKIKGNAIIDIAGQQLNLSKINGDIEFSTKTLSELKSIQILGNEVMTIENLTTFYEFEKKDVFVIYLGGFHNSTKRTFLKQLYFTNPCKSYFHFGDTDAGGFYILLHLIDKTGIPFKSYKMDIETLKSNKAKTIPLTENDKKRLQDLLKHEKVAFEKTIQFMLENNCKLEQENIA